MSGAGLGGDPPCWAHMFDDEADGVTPDQGGLFVVDLGDAGADATGGAIWSLPNSGDLNANLIRLDRGAGIKAHVNTEVDVLVLVQTGTAELTVDGRVGLLAVGHLAVISKGSERSITAGDEGVTYLSVHQQRGPLSIKRPPK